MRIKSIVPAIALALAASVGAATALADQLQYLGPSTATLKGGRGIFAFHDACDATFSKSTWCTSEMIIEGGPADGAPDPGSTGEWVHPVINAADGGKFVDFSSGFGTTNPDTLSCGRWTIPPGSGTGLQIHDRSGSGLITFRLSACDQIRPAACCGAADDDDD